MKLKRPLSLLVTAGMLTALFPVGAAAVEEPDVLAAAESLAVQAEDEGQAYDGYIFGLNAYSVAAYDAEDAADVPESIQPLGDTGWYTADTLEDIAAFAAPADLSFVEPDYIVSLYDSELTAEVASPAAGVNDAHLDLMGVPQAWSYGLRGADTDTAVDMGGDGDPTDPVVIAVIDSGLAEQHEDIDYSRVLPGANFVSSYSTSTTDTMGHGTFVTGEIIAVTGNGLGIDGIAEEAYVMPLKVFASRTTSNSVIINAINYAVEQRTQYDATGGAEGANICVINMSLGGEAASTAMKTACDKAIAAGIIVICAAGNDEDDRASYPAQYAIGVGATKPDGVRDYYSQILSESNGAGWQNKVWVAAPGSYYTSTWYTGGYYYGSGTSFSSPQVAALAAVAVSLRNDLTFGEYQTNHDAFKALLKTTSVYQDNGLAKLDGQDTYYGWGLVSFPNMIQALADLEGHMGAPSVISFQVKNGAGTLLTPEANNLTIQVAAAESGDIVQPEADGTYRLSIGTRYTYTVAADKHQPRSGEFVPLLPSRVIALKLDGKDYFTDFVVTNTAGETIPDPVINVTRSGAVMAQNPDGSFTTKNGVYAYTVAAPGYFPAEGSFTINDAETVYENDRFAVSLTLQGARDVCSVTFAVTGTDETRAPDAEVFVFTAAGEQVSVYSDGAWKLGPGEYTYIIESDYYKTITSTLTLTEEDKGTDRQVAAVMTDRLYWAFLDVMPLSVADKVSTTIVVKDAAGAEVAPFGKLPGEYRIVNGDYTYSVKAEGYKTSSGSFTMASEILYIDVELVEGEDEPDNGGNTGGNTGGSTGGNTGGGSSGGGGGGGGGSIGGGGSSGGSTGSTGSTGGTDSGRTDIFDVPTQYHDLADVAKGDWFYEDVNYVMTVGLFQGVSASRFDPKGVTSRAMVVTALWRLAGSPETAEGSTFSDVTDSDAWYYKAVAWAAKEGIAAGYNGAFSPDAPVTREELAAFLYRYAKSAGLDVTVNGDGAMLAFRDYGDCAGYAQEMVSWAYEHGILSGDGAGRLLPRNTADRSQVAAMLARFVRDSLTKTEV